ncbi:hypothetical protein D187_000951 [Cystobacter fuscus DSM 2262]|uniref:Uncharacterized protein n=1 Tax=Cystobacter fuscus (strain ATCC 25194 / DSM 2262 / NBRC 100088 / M29) TaxID=1242864 RepID=S9QWX7_CYSF2|nr:hypothetical protein [Cystobacter fuscus]EPX61168.1 hypothetical protein D187_000951 [Cystobacter fuscus DSM 2262]
MSSLKLGELVGKPYESEEVQEFVARMGEPEVDDEIGAPDTIYYTFESHGVELTTNSETNRIKTIFLKAPLQDQFGYRGELPGGLDFSMGRAQVHKALRAPDDSRSFYDVWEEGSHVLRVEYSDEKIKMIVLMGG